MQQQVFQQPIYERCYYVSKWIDEWNNKDLEYMFPEIVENIFGINNKEGWGLLNIDGHEQSQVYDTLLRFLHPNGPLFRLCYKLLSDPYVKYKFPLSFLPDRIKRSIHDGSASPFYVERLEVEQRTRTPLNLLVNPLELYMFHFMYHVTNPAFRQPQYQETKTYTSVYLRLAEEYLCVFLPCEGSTVLPELPNHIISQSPHRNLPQSAVRRPTLFKEEVLMKMLKQSPAASSLQTSPHAGIWRSQLTAQLCVDFWLNLPTQENMSASLCLLSEDQLPSSEHLNVVRLLVKHLHYFANSLVEDSSAMDQFKRVVIPSSQRNVYHFIRQTMEHWPLDSSFKQILEIWLSYIQPWRYINYSLRYNRPRGDAEPVDSRWMPFILENLLVYSVIFHKLIDRFKKLDLASPRNAHMIFRLTKVFSQSNLSVLISEVEKCVTECDSRGYYKSIQPQLLDLEASNFQYQPIFPSNDTILDFLTRLKEAESRALSRLQEELVREQQMSFWQRMFGSELDTVFTQQERKNVPIFLSASVRNLSTIFQISEESINSSLNNQTQSNTPSKMRPGQLTNIEDLCWGHPDIRPIRSDENTFLVRFLYHFCAWINYNFAAQLKTWYTRKDVVGGIARQLICAPQVYYYFDKPVPGQGFKVSCSLPPRLSLRLLANYHLLGYCSLLFLFTKLVLGLSAASVFVIYSLILLLVLFVRSLLGLSPLAPTVSIHDISDSRLNLSLLSLRLLANYHLLGYCSLLFLFTKLVLGLSAASVFVIYSLILLLVLFVRSLLGLSPLAPTVSIHDISDSRLNLSLEDSQSH